MILLSIGLYRVELSILIDLPRDNHTQLCSLSLRNALSRYVGVEEALHFQILMLWAIRSPRWRHDTNRTQGWIEECNM